MEKRILVVDDVESTTKELNEALENCNENFKVICKNNGFEALQVILEGNIDIMITDIAMPDMNGFELFKRTKELNEDFPVIMMTAFGYDPNHIVVNSKRAGLKDVILKKPLNIAKLIRLIKERLNLNDSEIKSNCL